MKTRKKIAALCLALLMALSMTACGFSAKMARTAVEMDKIGSFHMDMDLDLGVGVSLLGQQSSVDMLIKESMDVCRSPLTIASDIVTELGGETQRVLGYLLPNESGEGYRLFVSTDGGKSWDSKELESAELSEHTGYSGTLDQLALLAKAASSFKKVGTENVNGSPATRYDGEIEGEYVTQALENSGLISSLGEEFGVSLDAEGLQFSGSIPASIWVDEASARIVKYEMDMADAISSVWDVIVDELVKDESFAALRSMGLQLSISKAKVSATLSRFDEIGEIVLPEGVG